MVKKDSGTTQFEVSFVDANGNRRVALAHSESQAAEIENGLKAEREERLAIDSTFKGLEDIQVHKVTTTREPVVR